MEYPVLFEDQTSDNQGYEYDSVRSFLRSSDDNGYNIIEFDDAILNHKNMLFWYKDRLYVTYSLFEIFCRNMGIKIL